MEMEDLERTNMTNRLPTPPHPPVDVLGVGVVPLTVEELHVFLGQVIDMDGHAIVPHVNVHALNLAVEQPWLRDFYNAAPLVFCDGAGVMLGARILGAQIPQRITYADWMWQLGEFAAQRHYSLFLLGSMQGVAQAAAAQMQARIPGLTIAGWHHGYFDKHPDSPENAAVIDTINRVRPNLLIVGFGMPLQEQWLVENWHRVAVNVALPAGAALDYVSGSLQRAPAWMTDHGLEWLGRMLIEPGRLWKRYVVGNPVFLARVLKTRFRS